MVTGSCLCGAVQYEIRGPLAPIQFCHCQQCRKAQGGPFATNIPVDLSNFTLLAGSDVLKKFASSADKIRAFCSECGSPIYSQRHSMPDVIRLRAGTLTDNIKLDLGFHIFINDQAQWWTICDDLPQYPMLPD